MGLQAHLSVQTLAMVRVLARERVRVYRRVRSFIPRRKDGDMKQAIPAPGACRDCTGAGHEPDHDEYCNAFFEFRDVEHFTSRGMRS